MDAVRNNESSAKKHILIIGMLDSVHLYRWLEQFKDENIYFSVFASKKYRFMNKSLSDLIDKRNKSRIDIVSFSFLRKFSGFLDYVMCELFQKYNFRGWRLSRLLRKNSYDYIHALEIQGAGYLLAHVDSKLLKRSNVILTNWGSDIYYFQQFQEDAKKIREALSRSDFYSAECERDYKLARDFGFTGKDLPCIPNAGGFQLDAPNTVPPPSDRRQIMVKGYGGKFGRADIPISLIPQIAANFPNYNFFVYSVTDDVLESINLLPSEVKKRIRISTVRERIGRVEFLQEFGKSRVYIGCSMSDGVSTSFLEAIIHGTYPIQTMTSCAGEWVNKGYIASLVRLDRSEILNAILGALKDDLLVNDAARVNQDLAQNDLSYSRIRDQALTFYMQ